MEIPLSDVYVNPVNHSVLEKEDMPLMIVTTWHTNQNPFL